ncbi:MAG: hypothetical protein IH808_06205, partial [Proteobacteria bacterium]|nr:hypothetical protein [Pseudomonadota bacterium]
MPAIDHQSKRHVSLVIPGLLGPKSSANGDGTLEWPPTPTLELLLARADKQRVERSADFEAMIFELFDIDVDAEHDLPVAAVTLAGLRLVPESRDSRRLPLDIPGAILGTGGLIAL